MIEAHGIVKLRAAGGACTNAVEIAEELKVHRRLYQLISIYEAAANNTYEPLYQGLDMVYMSARSWGA